ncbi:hypothetical protein GMI69_03615 [Eggerthellaceae bacterium zg-887]|uniref:hypothetical protein n=1 Tax=Xiamenia xianingshaonis TaxID=2682776 RepID=UPI00140826ED|nr:hypothetical protein [Xiamenia xianingshaonis]NHM15760.1 hypothetical protein [Xiamenia xianingshaonis]
MVVPKGSIYSSTALATRQREVKDVADKHVVYITENGNGAYVFCSEEVFDRELQAAREEARYEAEMRCVLREARRQLDEGEYTSDVASFKQQMLAKRGIHG